MNWKIDDLNWNQKSNCARKNVPEQMLRLFSEKKKKKITKAYKGVITTLLTLINSMEKRKIKFQKNSHKTQPPALNIISQATTKPIIRE